MVRVSSTHILNLNVSVMVTGYQLTQITIHTSCYSIWLEVDNVACRTL